MDSEVCDLRIFFCLLTLTNELLHENDDLILKDVSFIESDIGKFLVLILFWLFFFFETTSTLNKGLSDF